MVRLRPTNTELLLALQAMNRPYFGVTDLRKLIGLSGKSLLVTVGRLVDAGVLKRLRRNTYIVAAAAPNTELVAQHIYYPAYLSFESALARHGILSQMPRTLTFATTRPSNKMAIGADAVEFREAFRRIVEIERDLEQRVAAEVRHKPDFLKELFERQFLV